MRPPARLHPALCLKMRSINLSARACRYLFNIGYNIYNKKALNALPIPYTMAALQANAAVAESVHGTPCAIVPPHPRIASTYRILTTHPCCAPAAASAFVSVHFENSTASALERQLPWFPTLTFRSCSARNFDFSHFGLHFTLC
eukprot:4864537-Pleurochrysis_carterae.AAC.1